MSTHVREKGGKLYFEYTKIYFQYTKSSKRGTTPTKIDEN